MKTHNIILSKLNRTLQDDYIYVELSILTYIVDPIVRCGRKNFYVFCKTENLDDLLDIIDDLRVDLNSSKIEHKSCKYIDYLFPIVLPVDEKYKIKMSTVRKTYKRMSENKLN